MPHPAVSALGQHQLVSRGVTPSPLSQHLDDFQMDIGPSLSQMDRQILYFVSDSWLSRAPEMNLTRPRTRSQLGA